MSRPTGVIHLLAAAVLALSSAGWAGQLGEGSDLEIGGPGSGPGQFLELRDMAFDAQNNLYVLDGVRYAKDKAPIGNQRVQKFDTSGKFLLEFSVHDDMLGEKNNPQRIAVDSRGIVYVTQPLASQVQRFSPDGKALPPIDVPQAHAICTWTVNGSEKIAVIGNRREVVKGKWANLGGDQVFVIDPQSDSAPLGKPVVLSQPLTSCEDVTSDAKGNLYALAETNAVYMFDSTGKLIRTLGSQGKSRAEDGSELLHAVAVDAQGNVYGMTWGNPGWVAKFDPEFKTVTRRQGQFKWADSWSIHSGYTPIAIDGNGRLWAAATGVIESTNPNFKHYRPRPCVVRTRADYLDLEKSNSIRSNAQLLGFKPSIEVKLPYNIAYDFSPVPAEFVVAAANRQISDITVNYTAVDMYRTEIAKGSFELKLQNNVEARQAFSITPPRYGWYTIMCEVVSGGQRLMATGEHFGVTPKFPNMVALAEGQSKSGWDDVARQMFVGLPTIRLHPATTPEKIEGAVAECEKYGAVLFCQFSDKKDCTVENVRNTVTRYKGRVKYWEIMNEPNFSMKPEQYAELVKQLYPLIKSIDPAAKVMGPDVCGVDLNWYDIFYKNGGKDFIDILSIHDYEGHESVDPVHWAWKIGALKQLMAKYGDEKKEIWQTERAITGVRGKSFLGSAQAVRVMLHRDLLETLGITPDHNVHYYLNEGGYTTVPSYLWSRSGPHPGALALRTRYAMTQNRAYKGTLDFGTHGNRMLMALRYSGAEGTTIVLRNLGTLDLPLEFAVSGGTDVEIVDAFGNATRQALKNGKLSVTANQIGTFIRLAPGQEITAPKFDFGENVAAGASVSYSAKIERDNGALTNGIIETFHAGHPHGGTGNSPIWTGELSGSPQSLEITLKEPKTIGRVLITSVRADNAFCALLDYDLHAFDGTNWVEIEKVRTPMPKSDECETTQSQANTWYLDNNMFVHQFKPLNASKLKLTVYRATHGFIPDSSGKAWDNKLPPMKLMLREIEAFAP
ncbi:MAG TPA: glycosyl hydrolase [Planctomycetota bacterium]|nr:glycosyl hydrolase [Planctomycetota bacterium]